MGDAVVAVIGREGMPTNALANEHHPRIRFAEDVALSFALGGLVIVPLAEVVLRRLFQSGISSAPSLVQHLTLIVGMLGGAIGARENRLLALSTLGDTLKGKLQLILQVFCGAAAAAISTSLCIAGIQFVAVEKTSAKILAYGIPIWVVQALLPAGFAIVALRLLHHSSPHWLGRTLAAFLAGAIVLITAFSPIAPVHLVVPALIALLLVSVVGVPVFVTLGGIALILFWGHDVPIASLPIDHYSLVTNPSIPAIPLFTIGGYFLAEGGAPKRLVRVFHTLFGQVPGGAAMVTALTCAFFTSFTGASGVTIIALGGLLLPVLLAEQYPERAALGLVTGAGSLGMLLPPCLPLILYAIVARVPIENIFLGGILPGILMMLGTAVWGIRQGRKAQIDRPRFEWAEARKAIWEAKWELLLPVVTFVSLFGGFATPVEAAAVTALYAFLAETVLYGDLSFRRDVPRILTECGLVVGGILLMLGVALGLTNYLVDADLTARIVEWGTSVIHSRWVFLLALNGFLLIVGCLMDIYSAIMIQVPLLVPLGQAFGINPIHLGIIFLANLEIGYLTPPIGLNLYMSSYRFKKPVLEILLSVIPIVLVMHFVVLLITFIPWLTTALPDWLGR
jgi:tripartite ATP-independent transporter DctM subunit